MDRTVCVGIPIYDLNMGGEALLPKTRRIELFMAFAALPMTYGRFRLLVRVVRVLGAEKLWQTIYTKENRRDQLLERWIPSSCAWKIGKTGSRAESLLYRGFDDTFELLF